MTTLGALPLGLQGDRVGLRRMQEDEVRFEGKYPTGDELVELGMVGVNLDTFEGGMAVLKARHAKAERDRKAGWKDIEALLARNDIAQAARQAERAKYPAGTRVQAELTTAAKVRDAGGNYVEPLIQPDFDDPARDYDALLQGRQPTPEELARPVVPEGQGVEQAGVGDGQGGPDGPPAPAGVVLPRDGGGAVENVSADSVSRPAPLEPRPARRQGLGFTPALSETQPRRLATMAPAVEGEKAGLWEVAAATVGEAWYVENFNAERRARDDVARDMIRQVYEATGVQLEQPVRDIQEADYIAYRDKYPEAAKSWGSEWLEDLRVSEFDAAIATLREQFPDKAGQIPTLSLDETALNLQRKAFATAEDARARAAGPLENFAGSLAGGLVGSFGDPLQVATLPIGFGSRTIVGAAIKEMAVNAGLVGGMELVRDKGAWKDVTGREYTVEDFFSRVGTAAAFGAAVGGGGKFAQQGAGRLMFDRTAFEVFRKNYDALPPDHPFRQDETLSRAIDEVERTFRDQDATPEGAPAEHEALKQRARQTAAEPGAAGDSPIEAPERVELRELLARNAQPEEIWATPLAQEIDATGSGTPTLRPGEDIPEGRTYLLPDINSNEPRRAGLDETIDFLSAQAREKAGAEGPLQGNRAIIVLGYPGAGKSTFIGRFAKRARAAVADSDEAKVLIPEYDGGRGSQIVNEESSAMRRRVLAELVANGDNLILETVGSNAANVKKQAEALKAAGYTVELAHVRVPADEAVRRSWHRYLSAGRSIAPSYARSILGTVDANWDELVDSGVFSRYMDIDYSGERSATTAAEIHRGNAEGRRGSGLGGDRPAGQEDPASQAVWDIFDEVSRIAEDARLAQSKAPPPATPDAPYPSDLDPVIARAGEDPTDANLQAAAEAIERELGDEVDELEGARFSRAAPPATPASADEIRAEAVAAFGEGAERIFQVVEHAPPGMPPNARAWTDKDGRVTIVAGRISREEVRGVILHEVGAHAGLRAMLGDDVFDELVDAAGSRAERTNGPWSKVWERVPLDTPDEHKGEELLGYFLELNPDLAPKESWWAKMAAAVRKWAVKIFGPRLLTDSDIVDLAKSAVTRAIEARRPKPAEPVKTSINVRYKRDGSAVAHIEEVTLLRNPTPEMEVELMRRSIQLGNDGEIREVQIGADRYVWPGDYVDWLDQALVRQLRVSSPEADAQRARLQAMGLASIDPKRAAVAEDIIAGFSNDQIAARNMLDVDDIEKMRPGIEANWKAGLKYSQTGKAQPAPAGTNASNPKNPAPGQSQTPAGPPSPELVRQRYLDALTKQADKRLRLLLAKFRNGSGEVDAGEFLQAILDYHGQGNLPAEMSVDPLRRRIAEETMSEIEAVLNHFRSGTMGRRVNKADLDNFVKEMFGEDSKDAAAKALAQAVGPALEKLRQRFNRAGGMIGKLDNWGLPQSHNQIAIRNFIEKLDKQKGAGAGKAAFRQRLYDSLDVARMRDVHSGKPMTGKQVWDALDSVIDDLMTDGWATRQPQKVGQGAGSLASKRADHRFLIFRDATTWLQWQRDFGAGDPVMAIVGHVEGMARDIAAMEVLGPNPAGSIEWLKQTALKQAAERGMGRTSALPKRFNSLGAAEKYVDGKIWRMEAMWSNYTGEVNVPVKRNAAMAQGAAHVRNVITSSTLGGAFLSAFPTDPVFQAFARHYAGASHATMFKQLWKHNWNPRRAAQFGVVWDHALSTFGDDARFAGGLGAPGWSSVLANQSLAVTGLTPWTRAGRSIFQMGLLADFGNESSKAFDQMDDILRRTLQRYGIGEREWDAIRAAPLSPDGIMQPAEIRKAAGQRVNDRLMTALLSETEYAIPSGTLRARSLMIGKLQAGTLWGEAARSGRMFLSFSTTLPLLYGYRLAQSWNRGSKPQGALYAAALVATLTFGGYVAMNAKAIASGKDTPDPSNISTWQAAFLQGGGLGIYGDFLFGSLNRMDRGPEQTLAGPVIGVGAEVLDLTVGNVSEAMAGKDSKAGSEWAQFAAENVPFSSTWYLRLAYDRWIEDALKHATDPKAEESFRRRAQKMRSETGQGYWWAPGAMGASRAPQVAEAPEPAPAQ